MSKWIPILAIDDDEIVRMALKRSLKLYGFETYLAEDGPTGIKLAMEKKPVFILLDWMMPEMSGLEVVAELRHNRKTQKIPIFMLTGKGMIGDVDQAFEIGVDDFITKPSDLMQLGKIVKTKWAQFTEKVNVR